MRHLLTIADLDPAGFWGLIDSAQLIKRQPTRYIRALYEKTLLMIFEAPSLRTRMSFETAMTQLHGHAINYYTIHSPWGIGKESIEDVARTISRYCDAVTARLFSHADLQNLAANASVPVINAMTNAGHPCQVVGDFLTMVEKLGKREGLQIAYCGDARNNVTYSLMRAAVLTGNRLRIACPDDERYRPETDVVREIAAMAESYPGRVEIVTDPREAAHGAEVVYTDSWMSYRVPPEEKERRIEDLRPYCVDAPLMCEAEKGALFMHCLPAMRGQEVAADVIDGPHSVVFDQAENRLHTEKAILLELLGDGRALLPNT
jgi:ornithine carbamoyltransferase